MLKTNIQINTVNDIIDCLANFEVLASVLGRKRYGTINQNMYLIPFLRNKDTGSVLAVGWSFGKPVIFIINHEKNISSNNVGTDASIMDFLTGFRQEVAANISKEKMIAIVIEPHTGVVLENIKLFNDEGPYVSVVNSIQ